jgi:hypothetical protein
MEIISTSPFLKTISKLKVTPEDLRALEAEIVANPQEGDVIKGVFRESAKSQQTDLSAKQRKELLAFIEELQ